MTVDAALLGTRTLETVADTELFGRQLGEGLAAGDLVVLTGALGAGKTTLTRGIGAGLGVRGPVQSPTFVLARTHPSLVGGPPLVHVDAYRLGSARELDDLDLDVENSVVIVEWGHDMVDGLRESWWEITLERPVGGRGADTMCGGPTRHTLEMEDEDGRIVTVVARP